jgi:hypothetical protein
MKVRDVTLTDVVGIFLVGTQCARREVLHVTKTRWHEFSVGVKDGIVCLYWQSLVS